jgi:hypothetical protein
MVRWASAVTLIRLWAVAGPSASDGVVKSQPMAFMSWRNTLPSWSSATLPMKATLPPKLATPAAVLAAEPPEASMPAAITSYRLAARAGSIRAIEPFTRPSRSRKASSHWAMTSTMALPMAATS